MEEVHKGKHKEKYHNEGKYEKYKKKIYCKTKNKRWEIRVKE